MNTLRQIPKLIMLIAALAFISNVYSQTCPTGLVSYWKMDETSGLTLTDFKSAHNATCSSELGRDYNGKVIYAQVFDNSKAGTVINHSDYSFGTNSSFTIVYWSKFTATGSDAAIISKGDYKGGNPTIPMWSSGINGSGKVNFLLSDGTSFPQLESTATFGDGLWHQVACVRDESTNTNYLYVDGTVVDQTIFNYTGGFTNSSNILIGSLINNSTPGFYFKGSVDEIAIYNRALSSTEINTQKTAANTNGIGICDGLNPKITSIPVTKASVNGAYSYTVHAIGQQAGMTYSLVTNPALMTIGSTTGIISWIPTSKSVDGLVKVRANNGVAPADTQTFRIYISDQVVCPSGLICLHKLNETAGPTYYDSEGSHMHDATASVSPSAVTGKINGGQSFNSSTKIDIPDNGTEFTWANNASFSFEMWVKTSTVGEMVFLGRLRTDIDTITMWNVGTSATGKAFFEIRDNGGHYNSVTGTSNIADNLWHHIVAVRNGSNSTSKIYVDGIEENSSTYFYANSIKDDVPLVVTIGYSKRKTTALPEYHFIGVLDEVAIFSKALSAAEITTSYNGGSPTGYCAEGNSAPAFTSSAVTTATEDSPYTYNITIDDIDASDVLVLSAPTLPTPSWLTLNWTAGQKTATLTGTPLNANVGNNSVTLRVSDGHSTIDQSFTINVINVNDDPVITTTPTLTVNEESTYTYPINVTDDDIGDVITISAPTKPAWLTLNYTAGTKTATLTGIPDDADIAGPNSVVISVGDGHTTITQPFVITVNPINDLPKITGQIALNVNEDQSITLLKSNLTIVDPDNSSSDLTLEVQSGTNYSFSGNIVSPLPDYSGPINVNVVVSDLVGSSDPFAVLITVNSIPDAPVFNTTPTTFAKINELYYYSFNATDADNEALIYSVLAKPEWLTFNEIVKYISGIPATSDIGANYVLLNVTDGTINVQQGFTITVGTTGITEANENEFIIYPVPASNELNVRFNSLTEKSVIDIISATGSVVMSVNVEANTDIVNLPLDNIKPGMYICHIRNNDINSTLRFLIAR